MCPRVIEYTLTLRIPATRPIAYYLANALHAVTLLVHTWNVRSRQRRALAALDARLLDDVAISASDRAIEISKPFWQA